MSIIPKTCAINDEYCVNGGAIRCKNLCAKHYARSLVKEDIRSVSHNIRPRKALDFENWCGRCSTFKHVSEFSASKDRSNGLTSICKDCASERWKAQYDPLTDKFRSIRRKYGITRLQYERMLDRQNGCCAICTLRRELHVDHNHETGEVRALLCFRCNSTLGKVDESTELLQRLIDYLGEYDGK